MPARPVSPAQPVDLLDVYRRLDEAYSDQVWHWLPEHGASALEIAIGAVLVQHTNWMNAERALDALRAAGCLAPGSIAALPDDELADHIRAGGLSRVKARRLKALADTMIAAGGLDAFLALPGETLRQALLSTPGIGEETADAIALYAAGVPTFVVDAYTRRLFERLGHRPPGSTYSAWKRHFEERLRDQPLAVYQRYHGWIVLHAKQRCRPTPICAGCPLLGVCPTGRANQRCT
jgi:endonuclease-3 related protein